MWAIMCITVRFFTANSSSRPDLSASRQEVPSVPDACPSDVPRPAPYSVPVQANQLKPQAAYPSFIHSPYPSPTSNLTFCLPCLVVLCECVCVCVPSLTYLTSRSCPHSRYWQRHRHPTLTCTQRRLPNLPLSNQPLQPNPIQLPCSSLSLCVNEQSGLLLLLLVVLINASTAYGTRNADGMW